MLNLDKALLNSLADARQRYALSVLRDRRETTESDLATVIASMENGEPLAAVSEETHRRMQTDLRHRQLPKLAAAGLVEWDRDAETVTAVDRRAFETEPVAELLDSPTAVTDTRERMLEEVARPRRRTVLSILESSEGSMPVRELGERVAAAADEDGLEEVLTSLYHVDLPKLEAVSLLTYDGEAETVTYREDEEFDARWVDDSGVEPAHV